MDSGRLPGMPVLTDTVGSVREVERAQHHTPTSDIHVPTLDFSFCKEVIEE